MAMAKRTIQPTEPPAAPVAKRKKIAIVGTAPQWTLAPFDNHEWEIWGLLGVSTVGKRLTRLYELHKEAMFRPLIAAPPHAGKYWEVAKGLGAQYITQDVYPEAPNATRFDFEAKIKKYGKSCFTSSAAWMLADAIDEDPEEIAIYGVNMAHDSEYGYQKPGCTFLLGWAKARGIKITIPAGSELMIAPYLYGYEDQPRIMSVFAQKRMEYQQYRNAHQNSFNQAQVGMAQADAALDLLKWFEQNLYTPDASTIAKDKP